MSDNEERMSVDEDENSSESSKSDEDDEQEKAQIARAEELEREINSNKFLYDAHVEIVDIYRKLGDLNSLREAYQRFYECFPLTPELWMSWLKDEMKIASTPEEKKNVFKLFDKAVEDYLSIDLWIEYAQYSIGASDLQTTRSILERGLTACGLHTSKGSLLWDTLREIENAHISLYVEKSEDWKEQVVRLSNVFKRQLSVPLLGMEETYQEFQQWIKDIPDSLIERKHIDLAYENALNLLESYKPFEDKILVAESNELADIYREYIKHAEKNPSIVICLYERALVDLCLSPDVWDEYCRFMFNLGDAAVDVSARALRNCPWSEMLWIDRLRILEKGGKEESEILSNFEKGLSSISPSPGLDLWLTYLEYVRRNNNDSTKIDKLFSRAIEQLGHENDPSSKLSRWHSRLLAKRGDLQTARKIWHGIMSNSLNKASAVLWLEYANLERQYGEPNQLRAIFKRAITTKTDWPQCIAEEWLMFERECGSLEEVMKCVEKTKNISKVQEQVQSQTVQNEASNTETKTDFRNDRIQRKRHHEEEERVDKFKRGKWDNQKPKREEFQPTASRTHLEKDPKKAVFVSNLHVSVDEDTLKEIFPNAVSHEIARDRKGKSRCYGYVQFEKEEEALSALARDRVPYNGRPVFISELKPEREKRKPAFKYATSTENNKLFVKGLPPEKTKEDVEDLFKNFSPKDVRLVVKKSGQNKGIAYVEFENAEAAQKALKATDQLKIDEDHTISVAISAPPPKKATNSSTSEPIRHARSRLQVPMIPRSLQVKSTENQTGKVGENGSSKPTSKSNADFRNMLLRK